MKLRRLVVLAAFAALASVIVAVGASGHRSAITPAPAFTASQLVAPAGDNWLTWNGNIFNQRYSTLNQINTDNVKDLKIAFKSSVVLPGVGKKGSAVGLNAEGSPIEYNGVLYLPDPKYNVYALNATTG